MFRPHWEPMEDRVMLSTMIWSNVAGGDWDVASNWVNQANPSDKHVPTSSDDAQITISNIIVTHASGTSDLVNNLTVASGTTLSLTSGSLSIAATSTISGNLTISGGTLTGAGTVIVDGATTWAGGTMSGSGVTDAEGGLTLGDQSGDQEILDQRTLENAGAATLAGYAANYGMALLDGATFDNRAGASFAFVTDAWISSNGGSPAGGTFDNEGTLSKTGGTGTSTIGGGISLTDTGTIEAASGTLQLSGDGMFAGTVEATGGGSLTTSPPTNLSSGTLTGATWIVGAGSSMSLGADITTDAATIVLDGAGADFSSLSPLTQIAPGGVLQVLDGGSFTTAGDLDSAGKIDLAPGTPDVTGNYTQEVSGIYEVGVGGPAAGSQFGQFDVSGLATLDGILGASLINGYAPPQEDSYQVLTFGSLAGNFSAEFGLEFENGAGFTSAFNPGANPTELDLVVVAEAAGTQTSLQSSENLSNYSDLISFTVDVTPVVSTSLVPAGTVTFYDGGTAIDTKTLVDGSASFSTLAFAAGTHTIVVQYSGDTNFSGGNSKSLPQVVSQDASTTAVTPSVKPSVWGQSVTFTATVAAEAPGSGPPRGTSPGQRELAGCVAGAVGLLPIPGGRRQRKHPTQRFRSI
jgi:Bacterial Ig-like domain (group 3)